jgi:hypothetical protein
LPFHGRANRSMEDREISFFRALWMSATVAQLAEQLICNQRVGGSIPFGGSRGKVTVRASGVIYSWCKAVDVSRHGR